MIHRIRDVRKAKGLTLDDVAARCVPPTTAQTIGRLETGTRSLSIDWLNRIAAALGVESSELVQLPDQQQMLVAAQLNETGVMTPSKPTSVVEPKMVGDMIAMQVSGSVGDYRAGDEIWLQRKTFDDFASALNCDILVPRPDGRFFFGRMIGRDKDRLHLLPCGTGARQQIVKNPEWIAVAMRLIRAL